MMAEQETVPPPRRASEVYKAALVADIRAGLEVLREQRNRLKVELAQARATNSRLNRRCQRAESGLAEKIQTHPTSGSFGRALANAAAEMYREEASVLRARVAELEGGGS